MEETIRRFEPRFLTLSRELADNGRTSATLRLRIEALLRASQRRNRSDCRHPAQPRASRGHGAETMVARRPSDRPCRTHCFPYIRPSSMRCAAVAG